MSTTSKIALAVTSGYLLGRTKKLKLAITVGSMLAGQRVATNPAALLKQFRELAEKNPEIAKLQEQEELDSLRPDLDGNQIMELLGIPAGRQVGDVEHLHGSPP